MLVEVEGEDSIQSARGVVQNFGATTAQSSSSGEIDLTELEGVSALI